MPLRDYTFLGITQSLCPECLRVVEAKIVERDRRVYFRKQCPEHGVREDFVCSDVRLYDRLEYSLPAKLPRELGVESQRGCPYDCGLCSEHEQHTCIGLVEITSSCNLSCPMCYASSGPGGQHLTREECQRAIDRLVQVEGRPEVLQLSGGEPTLHPEFREILAYAAAQPIDYLTINTNGVRLAHDGLLVELLASYRDRLEVYFQLDGLNENVQRSLRGEPLLETKLAALERLGAADVHVTLAVTLQGGVNDDQIGPLVEFGLARPWITGISFQPATYSGRYVLPEQLERRITFPDVIQAIAEQTGGLFSQSDFMPLPCAHPNCHTIAYAYRAGDQVVPLTRLINAREHLDLLANGISFTRPRARNLMLQYLGRQGCCSGGDCVAAENAPLEQPLSVIVPPSTDRLSPPRSLPGDALTEIGAEFFTKALNEQLGARDLFRITITSFLDAYNFDLRRLMKCCTHHILPSGHVIPFCAYNVLYRTGHVALPALARGLPVVASASSCTR